jgi:hypothetical protein
MESSCVDLHCIFFPISGDAKQKEETDDSIGRASLVPVDQLLDVV